MVLIPNDIGIRMRMQAESQLLQPTAPVTEIPADLPELRQGQAFSARILEALPENTYRALVAGKSLTLALPEGAKAGDTLDLVVVDRSPRVVVARLAPQPQAVEGAGTPYPYANVSPAGQRVAALLTAEGEPPLPAMLNRGAPLIAQAPGEAAAGAPLPTAAALAGALGAAVKSSGLFYESHQAQWVTGQFPLAQLLEEPQAQHSDFKVLVGRLLAEPGGTMAPPAGTAALPADARQVLLAALGGIATADADAAALASGTPRADETTVVAGRRDAANPAAGTMPQAAIDADPAAPPVPAAAQAAHAAEGAWRNPALHDVAELARLAQWRGGAESGLEARPPAATTSATRADGMPDDLRPVVQQQLDAAGTQRMIWHGEVWPRQPMEWAIERDGRHGSEVDDDDARWITSLTLTTPALGEVAARLQVGKDGVRIVVQADTPASTQALRAAVPELDGALAAAGVPLRAMLVRLKPEEAPNGAAAAGEGSS